jgi:hemerythrin superfamily protein
LSAQNDIFDRLKQDHDLHRQLLADIAATHGDSPERSNLFVRFTKEVKGHAAAEEQALYSTMMRKPPTTGETRHSVAEHHEIEEALNDLAAADMGTGAWLTKFKALSERYTHHIDEEEEEHFPDFAKHLTDEDMAHMRAVFERRKREEKAAAEVTPEKMEEAKD